MGHLGTSVTGLRFLIETETIPLLVSLAETSPVLSIRGTCFYVLGMISRTELGREQLAKLGWDSPEVSDRVDEFAAVCCACDDAAGVG
jgi:rapamycin-insensitive companion of mTOR